MKQHNNPTFEVLDPSTDLRSPTSSVAVPNIDNNISERQSKDYISPTSFKPVVNNNKPNTIKTPYKPSILSFINNNTFWARIFIIFITIFLCWLSSCYTIKQILSLTISKYWCDYKSLEEIRQHSRQNNLPHGSSSCWSAKDFTVQLFYLNPTCDSCRQWISQIGKMFCVQTIICRNRAFDWYQFDG